VTHREALAEALEVLVVESLDSYVWLGQRFGLDRVGGAEPAEPEALMTREIQERLYADFYCTGGVAPAAQRPEPAFGQSSDGVVQELSRANTGEGSRQRGWIVRSIDGDLLEVEREGLSLWVERGRVRADEPRHGAEVELVLPRESYGLPGGFYAAFGDAGSGGPDIDRFYWNVRPPGRVRLMRLLTTSLNEARAPFRFKVISDPRAYRCDAGVLYTPATDRPTVLAALALVHPQIAPGLRLATPVFTAPLATGLGFAEDPPGDESFGEHRCRLIAAAAVEAHLHGVGDRAAVRAAVEARLQLEGISLDAPHRNPGSPHGEPALPIP
jgi:HopA1 effector protein family